MCLFAIHGNTITAFFKNTQTPEFQKPPTQLSFWLPSIIIPITSNDLESQKYTA